MKLGGTSRPVIETSACLRAIEMDTTMLEKRSQTQASNQPGPSCIRALFYNGHSEATQKNDKIIFLFR